MSLSAAYVGSSANIQQMDDAALSNARQQHLLRLRQSVLPLQREHLAYLKRFCEDECRLGPYYTEIVYFDRHYETKPAAYKRWSAAAKKEYDRGLQHYRLRVKIQLQNVTYKQLTASESTAMQRYVEVLQGYIGTIESVDRDTEIGFFVPHPLEIEGVWHMTMDMCPIKPTLHSVWDQELRRRLRERSNAAAAAAAAAAKPPAAQQKSLPSGFCEACRTDDFMVTTIECTRVCTQCGLVASSNNIDETLDAVPYDQRQDYTNSLSNRGAYEMTANFLKTINKLEATKNHKVPNDILDFVSLRLKNRTPTINLIRHILKQGGHQKHYPEAVCILAEVTNTVIEKSTPEELRQLHQFHVQWVNAFYALPDNVRRRSSSLTNNYLAYKFYQMLGLTNRLKFIKMLKCPEKLAEHDRVFKLCVDLIRETTDAAAVASGTSYWQFFPTPAA